MANEYVKDDPSIVHAAEAEAIGTRRKIAWPVKRKTTEDDWKSQDSANKDFVGLALSGGGIRAASLGLGVLQTLCRNGLIRSVDYLSTVSGGGYIGSHFSSLVVTRNKQAELAKNGLVSLERILDDDSKTAAGKQPNDRERTAPQPKLGGFSHDVRKLIFGGKYLYRPWEATNKYLIGLVLTNLSMFAGVIAFAAFVALAWRSLDLPLVRNYLEPFQLNSDVTAAFLPAIVFFFVWLFCWTCSVIQGEAPGRFSQRCLYFMLASLMIGIVLLSVNGKETKVGWIGAVLGVGGAAASTGVLSKVLSGLLAAGLLPLLRPEKLVAMGLSQRTFRERVVFRIATFAFLVGIPLLFIGMLGARNISRTAKDAESNIRAGDVRNWPAFASLLLVDNHEPRLAARNEANGRPAPAELKDPAAAHAVKSDLQKHVHQLLNDRLLSSTKWEEFKSRPWPLRLWYRLSWLVPISNPLSESWIADRAAEQQAVEVCKIVNEHVLPSTSLANTLVQNEPLENAVDKPATSLPLGELNKLKLPEDSDTTEAINDAHLSYKTLWRADDAKTFNQWLLRTTHPECFFTKGGAYRWIVTGGDEISRLWVLGIAGAICCLGMFVDMNRASMHRFYRNRLMHAYVVPSSAEKRDINLSQLDTTAYGAPYHILNTTLELTHPTGLDEVDKECDDELKDRRDRQIFIFSQKYCGATAIGWRKTEAYEENLTENISLADAMALSGAASDAMQTNSLPLTVMMTALNLTLGQWMPNPALEKPRTKPRVHRLLRDWRKPVEDSNYAFVCDGGFTDNLGVLSLLKRRCKVIISLDAGCDANHEFSDLGGMLRMARIQDGIRVVTPSEPKPGGTGSSNNGTSADRRTLEMRTFETSPVEPNEKGISKSHFVIGRIIYPANDQGAAETGWLVYIKPSFTGDEGSDLVGYRRSECDFPHHTTADQFYDATRFESYRALGMHMCSDLCNRLVESKGNSLDERLASLYDKLSDEPGDAPSLEASVFQVSEAFVATNKVLGDIASSATRNRRGVLFAQGDGTSSMPLVGGQNGTHLLSDQIEMYLQELSAAVRNMEARREFPAAEKLASWDAHINQCSHKLADEHSTLTPERRADLQRKMSELAGMYQLLSSQSPSPTT